MNQREIVNILLVDDKPANLLALETILRGLDLNVVKATSGNAALANLLELEFACIVLDVKMPEMDGFELARIIRDDERTKYVPIIFASGHQQAQTDVFKGYETGAVDYLLKPLDPTIVRSKINIFAELYRKDLGRKRAEAALTEYAEELRRSNAELDQYASIAAHDLQAPLRRINSCAELLSEKYKGEIDGEADKWLKMMCENSTRMQALIRDLLDYAKVGKKQKTVSMDLSSVVDGVLKDLSQVVDDSGAKVVHENLPTVVASLLDMQQLMQNLIGNAIKYRKKGTPPDIHLSAEKKNSMWLCKIRDNGIGIEPIYQEKLFILFSRLHSGSDYPGTGIGLAICKKIVEKYGGKIWLESFLGEGATFCFTLPG